MFESLRAILRARAATSIAFGTIARSDVRDSLALNIAFAWSSAPRRSARIFIYAVSRAVRSEHAEFGALVCAMRLLSLPLPLAGLLSGTMTPQGIPNAR
jgi:hypothetical protein